MAEEVTLIFGNLPFLPFLIFFVPIIASFLVLFFGKYIDKKAHGNAISLLALGSSLLFTLLISGEIVLRLLFEHAHIEKKITFEWFSVGDFKLEFGILLDPLSAVVSLLVALVAFLVVVYSRSYMSHEGSPRYYAEINMFAAAMLLLCFSPNFIQLFIGWELMGVCSYLLIGYFYEKEVVPEGQPHPASAAKKAFLTTKVGDIFLFVGMILLYLETLNAGHATFDFIEIRHLLEEEAIHFDPMWFVVIALLIFGGAVGKSAQFPLHVWLPDAMAGPTTVSCLIHSATMVKAGIFLIARTYFIFEFADSGALLVIALIGGITAIMSGTIALVQTDIKGILAFSTISQLGYMTVGLGIGGMAVAIFHVINHGIFKALLFLSAGSVIHGSGTQDIREMGGLKSHMPTTWKVMLIGSLSLAGFGNGFFSKDAIISHTKNLWTLWILPEVYVEEPLIALVWLSTVITAFLTAFYIFRMWFLVFPGENRSGHHVHESDKWMTIPLWILAILSLSLTAIFSVGLIGDLLHIEALAIFNFEHHFVEWLEGGIGPVFDLVTGGTSLGITFLGIALAYLIYYPRANARISFPKNEPSFKIEVSEAPGGITNLQIRLRSFVRSVKLSAPGRGIQRVLEKGYYIDDIYLGFVHFIYEYYCEAMNWIEKNVFDRMVRFVGLLGYELCAFSKWWDDNVIDGAVRLTARASVALCSLARATDERVIDHGIIRNSAKGVIKTGSRLRHIQTGVVENYALYSLMGAIILILISLVVVGVLPL
ncbi:MAG: NADH-quinone oxidoreductase subunit 5 family protein [Candidatus Hodarchaeales archaeon]|jgi:NADH-quinone oxidoreductase subunit L